MGRFIASGYLNTTNNASVASKELCHILSGSGSITRIHEVVITARTAVSEPMCISLAIAATTNAAGSTLALTALDAGDSTLGGNIYGVASSNATGLTYVYKETVNTLNGFRYLPTPECRCDLGPGKRLVIRRETSQSTEIALDLNVIVEEIGR